MTTSPWLGGVAVAMANRNYRIFTIGAVPSLIGTWVQRMAVGWLAWELTHSGTWLGLVAFADLAPTVVVAPVAGAFADRVDRLGVVRLVQVASMVQSAALAALTLGGLITVELLFALALLQGSIQGVHQPFRQSLIGTIVDRREITSAIGINSTVWNTSRLLGPAISAAVILHFGVGFTFLVNSLSYVPLLVGLHMMRVRRPPAPARSLAGVPAEIMEGVRHVARHRMMGPLLVMLFVFSFFGRATAELLPGFAGAVFATGAEGLAVLTSGAGLGSLVSGAWLSRRGRLHGLGDILVAVVALIAVFQLGFVATDSFAAAAVIFVGWGFLINAAGITVQSLIQADVPDAIRGRVVSLYGILWLGTPSIGAFAMGAAADLVGFRLPVAAGAAVILCAFAWGLSRRRLFREEIRRMAEGAER